MGGGSRPPLTALTITLFVMADRNPPAVPAPPGPPGPAPTTTVTMPGEPVLYRANFAPAPGVSLTGPDRFEDGELRITIAPRSGRSLAGWRTAAAEHRLSVSVKARMTAAPPARLGLVCGELLPGGKRLVGLIGPDGGWEIEANGRVVASGSAPERQGELRETFELRLECVSDRRPTRAAMFLNGSPLGQGDGLEPFPMTGAVVTTQTQGDDGYDLAIGDMVVRRMG